MKYYNFRITNLGMGWWRWKPKYLPKRVPKARAYFFWFNWRIEWWLTDVYSISGSFEQRQDNNGDLLVWMIEKLRKREGGCTMNELVAEEKRNFKGIEQIKHRTINYR